MFAETLKHGATAVGSAVLIGGAVISGAAMIGVPSLVAGISTSVSAIAG